jgi:hypothetical protein
MHTLEIIRERLWRLRSCWKTRIEFAPIRGRPLAELEHEEHCLDAMRSWQGLTDQTRTLRHEAHTLIEDDPPSG